MTWSIVAGALPAGLTMGGDGIIKGKATVLGTFTFTARATDSTVAAAGGPAVADKIFSLSVGNVQITSGTVPRSKPAIVYNPNANESLVVYQEETSPTNFDIFARRMDADLNPIGSPVAVASSLLDERRPRVAYSATAHRYAVVFEAGTHIQMALLDDLAAVVMSPQQVDGSLSGTAREPVVAWRSANGNDQFAIVWRDNRNGRYELFSEARTSAGAVAHDDMLLRSTPGVDIINPAIAHSTGDDEQTIAFAEAGNIRAIQTNGDAGVVVAPTLEIQGKIGADNAMPDIVYESFMNRFMVVWQDGRNGTANTDIYAAITKKTGVLRVLGPAPIANTTGIESNPRVTYDAHTDSFVVTWEQQTDSGDFDIMARGGPMLLDMPFGPIVRVSNPTADPAAELLNEFEPAIATNTATGLAQIVWRDERGGVPQIFGETKRDYDVRIQTQRYFLVSADGTSDIRLQLFDFNADLNTLAVRDMISGRSFDFATHGRIESIQDDRMIISIAMNTNGLQGMSMWIDALFFDLFGVLHLNSSSGHDTKITEVVVTHVVFNSSFEPDNDGPSKSDALSIRVNATTPLQHGPAEKSTGSEYGAGEWICKNNDPTMSQRNEAALYLSKTRYPSGPIFWARFEAEGVNVDNPSGTVPVNQIIVNMVPRDPKIWPSSSAVTISFKKKDPASPLNKIDKLENSSDDKAIPTFKSAKEFTFFIYTHENPAGLPTVVRKTQVIFDWFVSSVNGETLENTSQQINSSGIPDGHIFYSVLDTPKQPWYDSTNAFKTLPWVVALEETIVRGNAQDKANTTDVAKALADYLINRAGYRYDVGGPITGPLTVPNIMANAPRGHFTDNNGGFNLQGYIDRQPGVSLNCTDQAAGLASYVALTGGRTEIAHTGPRVGPIKTINLVGWGLCNNPFFGMTPVQDSSQVSSKPCGGLGSRSIYAFHRVCRLLDNSKLYDGSMGPSAGSAFVDVSNVTTYLAAVQDLAAPLAPGVEPADARDTSDETSLTVKIK